MFKTTRAAAALAVAAALFSGAASAYTVTDTNAGNGYVTGNDWTFNVVSSNNSTGASLTSYGAVATQDETISFNWSYTSYDEDGGDYDPAGFYINGDLFQLSDSTPYGETTTGSAVFTVFAGDSFGWYADSSDSWLGSSVLSVQVTSVPEPANMMLILAGIGALGAVARRRKQA